MAVGHKQLVVERNPSGRVQLFDESEGGAAVAARHFRLRLGEADLPALAARLVTDGSEITHLVIADGHDRPISDAIGDEDAETLRQSLVTGGAQAFRELMDTFSPAWKLVSFEVRDPDFSVYQVWRGGGVRVIIDRGEDHLVDAVQRFLSAQ